MPRPRTAAGEHGSVHITVLADGRVRARTRMRDDSGALLQLRAVAATESDARAALTRRAALAATGGGGALSPESTIAEAAAAWLAQVHARATSGAISHSTYESYESSVRLILIPTAGAITLGALTVGRCDRIIQGIIEHRSVSAARRARAVFSQICGYAVRDDAMRSNPIRDVQRLPTSPKKTSVLTPAQITKVRALMLTWRADDGSGPRPNFRALIDGMDIMLGTSARIGECLGLRREDVDIAGSPPTLLINGTITQTRAEGIRRKDSPKRSRQRRRIALPSMAAAALRRRLALAGPGEHALLFPTGTGAPMSVSNYERLLRSFVADNRQALETLGVDPELYSTHIYRRTTATLIEAVAGITLASRLLGHANEQITRASYVVTAEQVDPSTARLLDDILNG